MIIRIGKNKRDYIDVLTDGHHWSYVTDISFTSEENASGLYSELTNKFQGHVIAIEASDSEQTLLENAGFRRAMNFFTCKDEYDDEDIFLPFGFMYENEYLPLPEQFPGKHLKQDKHINIRTQTTLEGIDPAGINSILEKSFRSPRDTDVTKKLFEQSEYVFFVKDEDKLIACARSISNGSVAMILNVAVDPDYQGCGVGRRLIDGILDLISEEKIVLNTHPGSVGFYNCDARFRRNRNVFIYMKTDMPEASRRRFVLPAGFNLRTQR
ncbi:MAG: GNAT family N-acetyltransferase [Clostridiales bacterium]|nr:GNAT family N-acetyltransferase [Clostridiales bacterium]